MEKFRNQLIPNHHLHQKGSQAPNKAKMEIIDKPIKVKYISNPMMVKANNESEFRAIVQKLTGQDSPHDAFDIQSHEQFNHVFYPPPSTTAASFDAKDRNGSVFNSAYDPTGVGEGRDLRVEMEGSISGFEASYVDKWR